MKRRTFLQTAALLPFTMTSRVLAAEPRAKELSADVIIIGGGTDEGHRQVARRVENLLPACKDLGVTHIINGCYRLHPVEWNIGESAGTLAAFCLRCKEPPRQVRKDRKLLADFQALLRTEGVELEWPKVTPR